MATATGALAAAAHCLDHAAGRAAGAVGFSSQPAGQVRHLRDRGAGARPNLGLRRADEPGPGRVLWPGRLRDGNAPEAGIVRRQAARFYVMERPERAAVVLGAVS